MKGRILGVFLVIVIVSQIPFAFRRYRLSRLNKTIQQLASQRITQQTENGYLDYSGVIHVHTALGGHSMGNFAELISAAKADQLDFVFITKHPKSVFLTSAMTLSGNIA